MDICTWATGTPSISRPVTFGVTARTAALGGGLELCAIPTRRFKWIDQVDANPSN
jgi:hypothetical protein